MDLSCSLYNIQNVFSIFSTTFNDVTKDRIFACKLLMATDKIEKLDFMHAKLFSRLDLSKYFFAFWILIASSWLNNPIT